MDLKDLVYEIVRSIPRGKVATYGAISKIANSLTSSAKKIGPRYVGYLLHNNPDPEKIPCHRIVDRNGKLAENYKFGGWKEQKRKLLEEEVEFRDEWRVDRKYILTISSLKGLC